MVIPGGLLWIKQDRVSSICNCSFPLQLGNSQKRYRYHHNFRLGHTLVVVQGYDMSAALCALCSSIFTLYSTALRRVKDIYVAIFGFSDGVLIVRNLLDNIQQSRAASPAAALDKFAK